MPDALRLMRSALAGAWVLLVVAGAWTVRPPAVRRPAAQVDPPRSSGGRHPTTPLVHGPRLSRRHRQVMLVVVSVAAASVWLPAAGMALGLAAAAGAARRRRAREHARTSLAVEIPDVIDLLNVAVASGMNVRMAVAAVVGAAPPGPLAAALRLAVDEAGSGARLADALALIPDRLGEEVRALVAALVDSERYGAPLGPRLERVADDARRVRQRRAEEAARRVPVKLLFPLVVCILPAFGLLTVAPLIAGGLRALRLS